MKTTWIEIFRILSSLIGMEEWNRFNQINFIRINIKIYTYINKKISADIKN